MQGPATGYAAELARPVSTWSLDRALKDPAVEEPINRWFHRRIAFLLIRPLEHLDLPVTPNRITLLSGLAGLTAAACFYHAEAAGAHFMLAGALLLFASVVLDCADGMLARLAGGGSRFGMLLDGFVDTVVGVSVWYGVSHTLCGQIDAWWAWPACLFVLPTILVHCAVYDDIKNRYLEAVHRPAPAAGEPHSRAERALDALYRKVYGGIAAGTTGESAVGGVDRDVARCELALPMRLTSFIGLGSNLFVIYAATLLGAIDPRAALAAITLAITLGSNLVMVVALVSWKRAWWRIRAKMEVQRCAP